MGSTTHHDSFEAKPRPVGQSLWLFASVAVAAVMVTTMSDRLPAAGGSARQTDITSEQLLELADGTATIPAPPIAVAPAVARTSVEPGPDQRLGPDQQAEPTEHELRGRAALAHISYPWQQLLPDWSITFLPEERGLYGLTKVPERRIEIYVRPEQSEKLLAHVIAHEIGHAIDVTLNSGSDRGRWETSRGLDSSPWWPGSGATDFSTGAGDFAESFAAWQVGDQSFRSQLAGPPSEAQIQLLAQLSAG